MSIIELMSANSWISVANRQFTGDEAREASDFSEVIANFHLSPDEAYEMFKSDVLSVGRRLYFARTASIDKVTTMLLLDSDERIGAVINERLKQDRKANEPAIITNQVAH